MPACLVGPSTPGMLAGRASAETLSDHGVDGRAVESDCKSGSKESSARNTNRPDASQRRAGASDGDGGDRRARRWKALQPLAGEETDLQIKMRDDAAYQGLADDGNVTSSVTRLLLMVWCQGRRKAEEVTHITSLRMEQTCETVTQATKKSLRIGLDGCDVGDTQLLRGPA